LVIRAACRRGKIGGMSTALIIVDIQNDYFPSGRMPLVGIERAAENARRLLEHFRQTGQPTFHIQHTWDDPSAPFFVAGTPGAAIHESVAPRPGEPVVVKHFPNSFRESSLLEELRRVGASDLAICGAMSHMCIDATTRAAADLGFKCSVAHDACATRDVEFEGKTVAAGDVHAAYMSALGFAYAKVLSTGDALKSLD
jgi:nicotinamidase-related amidase